MDFIGDYFVMPSRENKKNGHPYEKDSRSSYFSRLY